MSSLLELRDVTVDFVVTTGVKAIGRQQRTLRAVDAVSLELGAGATLGLVGESGSGKSTLARTIVGLTDPTSGQVLLDGVARAGRGNVATRRRAQMVFQDPTSSLNPALTVERALAESMLAHERLSRAEYRRRCVELMEMVELPAGALSAVPRQLSGGQRQRVAIARALAVRPELLIADEAVAALDVSVQAAIVNLLRRLQAELGLAVLLISHDLAVVRQMCDEVAVMYLGTVVEHGATESLMSEPQHPYTRALLNAAPRLGRRSERRPLAGEPADPMNPPPGCRFHPRCPIAEVELCDRHAPALAGGPEHAAACHFAWAQKRRPGGEHRSGPLATYPTSARRDG